jgi:hypothetical protein
MDIYLIGKEEKTITKQPSPSTKEANRVVRDDVKLLDDGGEIPKI